MLLGGTRDTGVAAKPADLPEGLSIHHSIHQTLSQSHGKKTRRKHIGDDAKERHWENRAIHSREIRSSHFCQNQKEIGAYKSEFMAYPDDKSNV